MKIKQLIKKALKVIFAKRPIHVTANITSAAPSELLKGRCALITGGTSPLINQSIINNQQLFISIHSSAIISNQ